MREGAERGGKPWREKQHIQSIHVRDTDGENTGCLNVREVKIPQKTEVEFILSVLSQGEGARAEGS